MVRINKTIPAKLFAALVAAILCFTVFTVPVSAKDSDGSPGKKDEKTKLSFLDDVNTEEPAVVEPIYECKRWTKVHSNPGTFEKNFILSPKEKEYSITGYEKVVSEILKPEMSDLEKYYTLAIWLNRYVDYDWYFWPGGYDFDYYSHQWDAYGVLKERKSVCAGIAVSYANLCHAAGLPCKFIRMKPYFLDHTINYIPDINGHAYYIDVTENMMFMSKYANPWDPMDPEFSDIPDNKLPDDGSFEYWQGDGSYSPSSIKEFYDVSFNKWFKQYALHKNTKKTFKTKYEEKGSGTRGTHYAKYEDFDKYPAQTYASRPSSSKVTGIWFLDDFFTEPDKIEQKILNKELDGELLNISGINVVYDCNDAEGLADAVSKDIRIRYFPSSENNKVVAEAVNLDHADYAVSCDESDFDPSTGEAMITISAADTGEYSGEYQVPVRFNSAVVTKEPVNNMDLVYTGEPQPLVKPGKVKKGTILYAAYNRDDDDYYESLKKGDPDAKPYVEPDIEYSEEIPVATDAGRYSVWYKVVGDDSEDAPYFSVEPQRLERVAVISKLRPKIDADDVTIKVGEKIKLSPTIDLEKAIEFDYMSDDESIATVSTDGIVRGVATGTTKIMIAGTLKVEEPNYDDADSIEITVEVNKGLNPMKLKAKTAKIDSSKLSKKAQKIKRDKLIKVSKAQGKLTYKLVSVKKGNKNFKKYFKVNSKNGTVTVKKGLKKGKYVVKVKVKAAGNANYNPSSWKSVKSKVRVE